MAFPSRDLSHPHDTEADNSSDAGGMMDESPFMSLPPELRNHIYTYVLSTGTICVHMNRNAKYLHTLTIHGDSVERPAGGECLALLRTCKQVSKEAAQLFYVCNKFEIAAFDPHSTVNEDGLLDPGLFVAEVQTRTIMTTLREFLKAIGTGNAKALTDVTFAIGQVDVYDLENRVATDVIMRMLDSLGLIYAGSPWWHLKASMALLINTGLRGHRTMTQHVVLDVADPRSGTASAIAALEEEARNNVDGRLYDRYELKIFIDFLRNRASPADSVERHFEIILRITEDKRHTST
ncbi:hypothetical protein B0A55_13611 [Friedmanniomyces simplex]|uniref:DUF7730 domain-containing protein n=1 Tax=Friedmanniomyces simplex TaxID=329884 RepID=A0A4U0VLR2_9PEZI|nr:hypothetical protein B0A55_13611 [Friedmanniomyces simplex]